ncbi:unnamed protein product [Polarella glacialis]|uniref:J domain-containing protein n=1 Tax=Polarella glacialis TaxID=89957 RepID=A0A813ENG9_POLGL|nr:unnamed protein product [Polarella glacialis]CAE8701851.1 unnamed protein product [Polarella glacialis]
MLGVSPAYRYCGNFRSFSHVLPWTAFRRTVSTDCEPCRALLGLPSGKVQEHEVRKAYRSVARQLHPDRGGKSEAFQELQKCYEQLLAEAKGKTGGKPEWLTQMKKDFATYNCC